MLGIPLKEKKKSSDEVGLGNRVRKREGVDVAKEDKLKLQDGKPVCVSLSYHRMALIISKRFSSPYLEGVL